MGILGSISNLFGSSSNEPDPSPEMEAIKKRQETEQNELNDIEDKESELEKELRELVGKEEKLSKNIEKVRFEEIDYYPAAIQNIYESYKQLEDLTEKLEEIEEESEDALEREKEIESNLNMEAENMESKEEKLEEMEDKIREGLSGLRDDIQKMLDSAYDSSENPKNSSDLSTEMILNILNYGAPDYWDNLSKRLKRILGEQGEELGEARNFLYDVETWEEMEHAEEEEVNRLERELEKLTQEVDILSRAGKDENELLESAEEIVSELKNRKDFQHAKEKKEELSTRKLAEAFADENQDPDKLSILLKRMFEEVEKMEENPREETLFEEVSRRATSLRHNIEEIENLREVNKNEKKKLLSKLSPLEEEMKRAENALGKLNNHCKEYVGFCNSQIKSIEKLGVQEYLKASPIDSSEVSQLNQVQHNLKLFRYNVGVLRLYMMGHENIDEDKYASDEIDISSRELREKTYKKGLIPQIETFTNGLEKLRSNA